MRARHRARLTSTTAAAAASTAPREVRLNGTFEQLPAEMQGWLSQMEQTIRKWGEYSAGMPSLGELGAADALAKECDAMAAASRDPQARDDQRVGEVRAQLDDSH